jgi:hypothetical protein
MRRLARVYAHRLACVLACLIVTVARADVASVDDAKVARVKAAYVLNFVRFTEWPVEAFADSASPIVIGVLDGGALGDALDETVAGRVVGGRAVVVERHSFPVRSDGNGELLEHLRHCHVLYIGRSEGSHLAEILPALSGASTLTVGDVGAFAAAGTMLALNIEGDRVVFYANPDALRAARPRLSSKVLQLAKLVETGTVSPAETRP